MKEGSYELPLRTLSVAGDRAGGPIMANMANMALSSVGSEMDVLSIKMPRPPQAPTRVPRWLYFQG